MNWTNGRREAQFPLDCLGVPASLHGGRRRNKEILPRESSDQRQLFRCRFCFTAFCWSWNKLLIQEKLVKQRQVSEESQFVRFCQLRWF